MSERRKNPAFEHGKTTVWFADGAVALKFEQQSVARVVYADPGRNLPESLQLIHRQQPEVITELQTALDKSRTGIGISEQQKVLAGETIVKLSEMSPSENR
jgi:hypothetical protein